MQPKGGTGQKKLDLLYVQDGGDYLNLGNIESQYEHWLSQTKGNLPVFVLVHPGTSLERWNLYHRRGDYFQAYLTFFAEELVPAVEKQFQNRIGKRGLLGDSLGGSICLNIAGKEPAMWSHLLLQSAAISSAEIQELGGRASLPWYLYQSVGIYEDEFISPITNEKLYIYSNNEGLKQAIESKVTDICYRPQEENHLWEFWKRDLPHAMEYFFKNG